MNIIIYDENKKVKLGELIGHGHTRTVFNHPNMENVVIKTHRKMNTTANKVEYDIYCKLKDNNDFGKYLCPILAITDDYQYLYMKKAKLLKRKNFTEEEFAKYELKKNELEEDLKKKYEKYFLRSVNYGIIDDNVVIIDYASKFFRNITK
jgi:hypothetical protein